MRVSAKSEFWLAVAWLLAAIGLGLGCTAAGGDDGAGGPDGGTDTDTGTDTDSDTDTDTDADSDSDSDSDSDTDTGDPGPEVIELDCSECPAIGSTLEHMACALDVCDPEVLVEQAFVALLNFGEDCALEDTYEAVEQFGDPTNDLGAKLNGSYALMATGPAEGTAHSTVCDDYTVTITDPWTGDDQDIHDAVEWSLTLTAPEDAEAFRFKYVFFSEEYDDYISSDYNDRFYVVLEAGGTNGGEPTLINFTECRDPLEYHDFICQPGDLACEEGEPYCYVAINSAHSDCCWYDDCPDGYSWDVGTDITGTGFACSGGVDDGAEYGSSTGWLQTSWPIDGGETFVITFHIHDTEDGIFDSEVILDALEFLKQPEQGTVPVVE
jgi:hypothetical protein